MFGYLLSFNKNDSEFTIWEAVVAYDGHIQVAKECGDLEDINAYETIFNRYVIFADTPFGNEIAFGRTDDSVVFIDHETLDVEKVADSFDEFLDCLYE